VSKHTPGPWHVHGGGAGPGLWVAECRKHGLSPEEIDANMALIAAAPELLSVLRGVLDSIEAYIAIHKPEEEWDEYDYMMLPRWKAAHALMEKLDGKKE
jgi:hypothetical protein